MDKELKNILKKANKLTEPEKEKEVPVKVFAPSEPYDYLVFTKLVAFSGFNKLIFLFLVPTAFCVGFLLPRLKTQTIYSLLIYGGVILIYNAINVLRYQFKFKGWKEKLPFAVNGWDEMIRSKKMFCDLCWNDTRITVEQERDDAEVKQLIEAALTLFCKRTETAFYTKRMGSTSKKHRQDWKIAGSNRAEGSANPKVMRYMKNLFEEELSTIAKKTGKLKSVKVEVLSEEFEVQIEIENGD